MDSTWHMIEFDVLREDSSVGSAGKRMRLFLDEDGYARALVHQKCKQIKIRRHAFVIEGNLVYDRKKNKSGHHLIITGSKIAPSIVNDRGLTLWLEMLEPICAILRDSEMSMSTLLTLSMSVTHSGELYSNTSFPMAFS